LQALDPVGDGLPQFLDLVFIFDKPRIVRHALAPPKLFARARVSRLDDEWMTTVACFSFSGKPALLNARRRVDAASGAVI
jgi:hypothetical protein